MELTKSFMYENGKKKKAMKVSWAEYLKNYERNQKELEDEKKLKEKGVK